MRRRCVRFLRMALAALLWGAREVSRDRKIEKLKNG
jgi:hypothetical protein